MKTIKVNAVECSKCGDIIYSRARHDFHWCTCKDIAIDGGLDYVRTCYTTVQPKHISIEINATAKELYDDWNLSKNKFGLIKPLTKTKKSNKVKTTKQIKTEKE